MRQVAKVLDAVKELIEADDLSRECTECSLYYPKRCLMHRTKFNHKLHELRMAYSGTNKQ